MLNKQIGSCVDGFVVSGPTSIFVIGQKFKGVNRAEDIWITALAAI